MPIKFRSANRKNSAEMHFIAEQDSKIPLLYDLEYTWDERSISARVEFYEKQIALDDLFLVATDGDNVIGFHIVKKVPYPPNLSAGVIITLWVDPSFRGNGIAQSLKRKAEKWAKSLKLDHLQTGVHSSNQQMLAINEKSGFKVIQYTLKKKL